MKKTEFSVAMSVYKNDDAGQFDLALRSVSTEQTVKPSEIVLIVDGAVSDGINDVIDRYGNILKNENISFNVIRLGENAGLGNALRIAVENSTYDLIARMDSDDIAVGDRFEQQLSLFEKDSSLDMCGGDISEFYDNPEAPVAKRNVPKTNAEIYDYMKKRCPLNHVTVMYKKKSVLDAGNYLDWFWNEDYYLWIRMALKNMRFANTGTVLVNVRTGRDMYKRRGGRQYYRSERDIQKFMYDNNFIGFGRYIINCLKRKIVEIYCPNWLREKIFIWFARSR